MAEKTQQTQTQGKNTSTNSNSNSSNPVAEAISKITSYTDKLVESRIKKATFDKTYTGIITEIKFETSTSPADDDYNKYSVRFNTIDRDFIIDDGKFHNVGERVLVHLPNNDLNKRFIETLNDISSHPLKIVYDDEKDEVTEYWNDTLSRTFIVTVENKGTEDESVTKLIFPDGSEMELEGF